MMHQSNLPDHMHSCVAMEDWLKRLGDEERGQNWGILFTFFSESV